MSNTTPSFDSLQHACDFVGQAVVSFDQRGVSTDRPSGVMCPNCQCELVIGEVENSKFAGCPSCRGMLFQQDVFGMLIQYLRSKSPGTDRMPAPLDLDALKVRRLCPACDQIMETHSYAGPGNAVIDSCFACQIIFLDQGELTKLVEAPGRRV
ncbi:MAG: hypothetical protein HKN47_00075 [Pirellulaceae bacterium]|nr:hypothetical protein [Pirellulaceae bacterium]